MGLYAHYSSRIVIEMNENSCRTKSEWENSHQYPGTSDLKSVILKTVHLVVFSCSLNTCRPKFICERRLHSKFLIFHFLF